MDDLQDKISQVKDEHAAEIVLRAAKDHDEQSRIEAAFILGRIKQVGHDARSIASALCAQEIRALEQFQQERLYERFGYATFVDFLEKCPFAPMSKRQYYDRLALIREHGDEIYDLLTSVGISVRAQKLLGKGDLAIKGDRLMIGDREIEVGETAIVKEVLEELFDERRELTATVTKLEEKAEKLTEQLDRGQQDFEQLQRNLDAMRQGDPHDRALADCVFAFRELAEAIGQMADDDKTAKGPDAVRTLFGQLQMVRTSYGIATGYDDPAATINDPRSTNTDLVSRVLAENDDFGDESEVAE